MEPDRQPLGVLVAFGDPLRMAREGIAGLLVGRGLRAGGCSDAISEVAHRVARDAIDVVVVAPFHALIAASRDGGTSLSRIGQIRAAAPAAAVIVLAPFAHRQLVQAAMGQGATGFLLMSDGADVLEPAVYAVAGGATWFSPGLGGTVGGVDAGDDRPLDARDIDLLLLTARGLTNPEIARVLQRSLRSIEGDRARFAADFGLESRADWVAEATARGLVG